jgi:FkbM family methyltransferase
MEYEMKYKSEDVLELVKNLAPLVDEIDQNFINGGVIYGAGFVGTWACEHLQNLGVKVDGFLDRDTRKTGSKIHNVLVKYPEQAEIEKVSAMLIAARHVVKQVADEMSNYDFPVMSFDGYFVVKNYARLASVRDNFFQDEKSIETFNALLIAMLTGSVDSCLQVMEKDMYFGLPEFSGNFEEIFVDAGAFVGDSVERFIWENLGTFRHLYAFEPGYKQFAAMTKRMERLSQEWAIDESKVSLVKAGLSSEQGRMNCTFVNDDPLRHGLAEAPDEATEIDERISSAVWTLDAYLAGKPITFLKADVEGMEMPLLRGAEETIKKYKPKMALCVYHYPSDLYEIAEYVRQLVPEYQFRLRQHAPLFGDFVLYCHV